MARKPEPTEPGPPPSVAEGAQRAEGEAKGLGRLRIDIAGGDPAGTPPTPTQAQDAGP